jgi:hypothetical protein
VKVTTRPPKLLQSVSDAQALGVVLITSVSDFDFPDYLFTSEMLRMSVAMDKVNWARLEQCNLSSYAIIGAQCL